MQRVVVLNMKVLLLTFFIFFIFNSSSQQAKYSEAVIPKTDYNYARIIGVFNDTMQVWNTGLNTVPTIYIYNKDIRLIGKVSIPVKKFTSYQLIKYKSFYYAFIYPLDKKEALIILKISASGNINTLSGEKIIGLSNSTKETTLIEIQKNKSDIVLLQKKEDADAGNKMMLTTYDSLFNKKDEVSLQYKNEKEKLSSFSVRIPSAF